MAPSPRFHDFRPHPWHGLPVGPDPPRIVTAYIEIAPLDTVKYEIDKLSRATSRSTGRSAGRRSRRRSTASSRAPTAGRAWPRCRPRPSAATAIRSTSAWSASAR